MRSLKSAIPNNRSGLWPGYFPDDFNRNNRRAITTIQKEDKTFNTGNIKEI
jgi:hypothetical protein